MSQFAPVLSLTFNQPPPGMAAIIGVNIMIVEYIEIDESITLQVIGRLDMPGAVLVVTTSDSDGDRREYHYSD